MDLTRQILRKLLIGNRFPIILMTKESGSHYECKGTARPTGYWLGLEKAWCPQRDPSNKGANKEQLLSFNIELLVVAA